MDGQRLVEVVERSRVSAEIDFGLAETTEQPGLTQPVASGPFEGERGPVVTESLPVRAPQVGYTPEQGQHVGLGGSVPERPERLECRLAQRSRFLELANVEKPAGAPEDRPGLDRGIASFFRQYVEPVDRCETPLVVTDGRRDVLGERVEADEVGRLLRHRQRTVDQPLGVQQRPLLGRPGNRLLEVRQRPFRLSRPFEVVGHPIPVVRSAECRVVLEPVGDDPVEFRAHAAQEAAIRHFLQQEVLE